MEIAVHVEAEPYDAEDDIYNALQDAAFRRGIELIIETRLEQIMGWSDINVNAKITNIG